MKIPITEYDETILHIIAKAKDGIDCTESECTKIKQWVRDTLVADTWQVKAIEDIQLHFPIEYGEAIDEQETQ